MGGVSSVRFAPLALRRRSRGGGHSAGGVGDLTFKRADDCSVFRKTTLNSPLEKFGVDRTKSGDQEAIAGSESLASRRSVTQLKRHGQYHLGRRVRGQVRQSVAQKHRERPRAGSPYASRLQGL